MRRKANRNALLAKLVDNEVRIIDNLSMAEPKTRAGLPRRAEGRSLGAAGGGDGRTSAARPATSTR